MKLTVYVSGKTYTEAIEGSGVPSEEHWPIEEWFKFGRGWRVAYVDIDLHMAELIVSHLEQLADCWTDSENRASARALRKDITRIRAQMEWARR